MMLSQNCDHTITFRQSGINTLGVDIHRMILALDTELATASTPKYREQLVKTIYSLRNLEEIIYLGSN